MPILVSQDWTTPAGSVLNYGYDTSDLSSTRIEFRTVSPGDTPPSLYNHGELRFYDTAVRMTPNYFYSFLHFDAAGGIVENTGLISAVAPNTLHVLTIYAPAFGPSLYNSGTVEAVGAIKAVAYLIASPAFGDYARTVTNTSTGLITANAALGATGVSLYNGGTLDNAGTIRATSTDATRSAGTGAVAFSNGRASVHNTGLIEAIDANPDTNALIAQSVGISYAGHNMGPIVNDGVIRGDYALYEASFSGGNQSVSAAVNVTNNGLLDGNVFLALGDDVLLNNGQIIGWVDLGEHADTYDGRLGTITGAPRGGNGDDTLRTGAGDNTLYGDAGNDILAGGGGADSLDGGADSDTASYEDSPSAVTINLQAGTNAGGDAAGDTFVSIENITGSAFGDVLTGDANANTLTGLAADDNLAGGGGDDTLNGGAGVDSLDGGADYDRISFYALNATQGASADLTTQTIANDGFGNAETMTGIESFGLATSFADDFNGNNQANEFFVGTGDQAYGQAGDDTFWIAGVPLLANGGDGIDTINFAADTGKLVADSNGDGLAEIVAQTHGVFVDIASGTISDDGFGGSSGAGAFIEFERVVGSTFADTISGDSNANVIHGGDGYDTLSGGGGDDTILGEAGNDTLIGGAGADTLQGGADVDTIRGGAGADIIQGGDGAFDTATYDTSASGVAIDLQNHTATGGDAEGDVLSSIERLTGSAFDDTLYGDGASNVLTGGAGNDFLDGRGEGDTLYGGDGDDFLIGSTGDVANQLNGGDGFDTVSYANSAAPIFVQSPIAVRVGNGVSSVIESLSSIEKIIGSSFDDTMFGDGSAISYSGGGGSDSINAGGGSDVLDGDAGDDYLFGGEGNDTLQGGDGNDWLDGGAGADSLGGGAGTDDLARYDDSSAGVNVDLLALTASGGHATGDTISGIESVSGSAFNDQLSGDANPNRLIGNGGNDFIQGRGGADNIQGGDGDDWLDGGAGGDTIDGGAGVLDVAAYGASASAVNLDLQNSTFSGGDAAGDVLTNVEGLSGSSFGDQLFGNASSNRLFGQGGNDFIQGRGGNDTIDGGDGDDWLDGGAGADQIFGGAGTNDIVAYGASTAAINADLAAFTFTGGDAAGDTYSGVEGVSGSSFGDQIFGDANANRLFGQGGNDFIQGRGGNDVIDGGDGDDWLDGGAGADQIFGGAGTNDIVAYGASNAAVNADLQAFTFSGGDATGDTYSGVEGVSGSGFGDQLFGNGSANRLFGQGGNDFIQGRGGNDVIDGGNGDDWLDGGAGGDQIFGGAGTNDVVAYGSSLAAVTVDMAAFTFSGGDATGDTYSGIEGVSGSGLNDQISGDANANRLYGQAGADTLAGRGGNDQLTGGNDNDIFVFADNGGVDTIFDFDDFGDDTIQLSITGITGFAGVQAVMTQVGADVVIDFATTDIVLVNTTLASMGADDFAFV